MIHATKPLIFLLTIATLLVMISPTEAVTVRPEDTGEALCNPGMGWVFHHFDNSLSGYGAGLGPGYAGEDFPGLTVGYLRLAWAYLEPEEGKFDWSIVDTVAQRYIRAGKRIAFRFTCFESGEKFATPEWVKDLGAKGYWWKDGVAWEPDYDDPIFLEKLEQFLAAAGARYDASPYVDFIDVGTIGIWGEGHPCTKKYGFETLKRHIDLHRKYFPNTLLAAQDDWAHNYYDFDFRRPGAKRVRLVCAPPEDARGKQFTVKVGIWIPEDNTRPAGRLIPAWGEEDRRVPIGVLSVADDGSLTFTPSAMPQGEGGQYRVSPGELVPLGRRRLIETNWQILEPLPDGSQIFCHFVRDDEIAFGGWAFIGDKRPLDYARSLGITLRDDSILVQGGARAYLSAWLAPDFWPNLPVILEKGHYGYCKSSGTWEDGHRYLDAVEDYHASYVSIHADPHEFLRENEDLIARMNRRVGYRMNITEASWPETIRPGETIEVAMTWRNAGVAPCYGGGYPAITLANDQNEIIAVMVDESLNVRDLPVAEPGAAEERISRIRCTVPPGTQGGEVQVRVSIGDRFGTPTIALPLADGDGTRRYTIGKLTVLGEYGVEFKEAIRAGDELLIPVTWTVHVPLPAGTAPFCHLDLDGKIATQATVSADADFTEPGEVGGVIRISVPEELAGEALTVATGLWKAGDSTRPFARMAPDQGNPDRRVTVGTVRANADGEMQFAPGQ